MFQIISYKSSNTLKCNWVVSHVLLVLWRCLSSSECSRECLSLIYSYYLVLSPLSSLHLPTLVSICLHLVHPRQSPVQRRGHYNGGSLSCWYQETHPYPYHVDIKKLSSDCSFIGYQLNKYQDKESWSKKYKLWRDWPSYAMLSHDVLVLTILPVIIRSNWTQ